MLHRQPWSEFWIMTVFNKERVNETEEECVWDFHTSLLTFQGPLVQNGGGRGEKGSPSSPVGLADHLRHPPLWRRQTFPAFVWQDYTGLVHEQKGAGPILCVWFERIYQPPPPNSLTTFLSENPSIRHFFPLKAAKSLWDASPVWRGEGGDNGEGEVLWWEPKLHFQL